MNKIALLLSGGVDSSVALHLLCKSGERPDCFYIHIGPDANDTYSCTSDEDVEMCRAITARYGVNFEIVDLHNEYWANVVKYTIDKVSKGFTPNPDVMCNTLIKFGTFYDKVGYKYDYIATGHYATIVKSENLARKNIDNLNWNNVITNINLYPDECWIAPAKDPVKDQVDFIANIDTKKVPVSKLLFPVGNLMKNEVRKIAEENHLINAKRKDSQGICFLGKINYNKYIEQYLGKRYGPIIDIATGHRIGTHNGYWFHTIGQRKGLGLSGGPWFVVKKNIEANIIYVSRTHDDAQITEFEVGDVNWLTRNLIDDYIGRRTADSTIANIKFKIRHTPDIYDGVMKRSSENSVKIVSEVQLTAACGQFCTIYDEDYKVCYGCGEIR